jgi:hypothetical protein
MMLQALLQHCRHMDSRQLPTIVYLAAAAAAAGGGFLLMLQLWMAVTATANSEQLAVASLIAYDVYRWARGLAGNGRSLAGSASALQETLAVLQVTCAGLQETSSALQ